MIRSSRSQMFFKLSFIKNVTFTGKRLCWSLFLIKFQALRAPILLKRDSTQVFSCEICEIFKNILFYRTPLVAASIASISVLFDFTIKFHTTDVCQSCNYTSNISAFSSQCVQEPRTLDFIWLIYSSIWNKFQKQPPEVFCKIRCSKEFRKFHRKKPCVGVSFM